MSNLNNTTEVTIPAIPHADVSLNERNRVVIKMHEGWVFYDKRDYRDSDGNYYDPKPEDYIYSRYGVFSSTKDFSEIVVVAESDVPAEQIFAIPDNKVTQ